MQAGGGLCMCMMERHSLAAIDVFCQASTSLIPSSMSVALSVHASVMDLTMPPLPLEAHWVRSHAPVTCTRLAAPDSARLFLLDPCRTILSWCSTSMPHALVSKKKKHNVKLSKEKGKHVTTSQILRGVAGISLSQ